MANSKINKIIDYLQQNGSITSMDAFYKFQVTRLAAVIFVLKKRGHDIETKMETNKDGTRYARYILNT